MSRETACLRAAFFWLSLELAARRVLDLDAHLAFAAWTLQDVRAPTHA
jgi:hypothetical protein